MKASNSPLLLVPGPASGGPAAEADLRIINTCSVTTEAAAKSGQLSRRAARENGRAVVSLPQLASDGLPQSFADGPIDPFNAN